MTTNALILKTKYGIQNLPIGALALSCAAGLLFNMTLNAAPLGLPEKEELTFGFIKLTDMAPLAVAYEKR